MSLAETTLINFASLENAPVQTAPFPFLVIPDFLRAEFVEPIARDFPKVDFPGSIPLSQVSYGTSFQRLIQELEGETLRSNIQKKFDVDLTNRPTLITVRGRTRAKDGRIHSDTRSKLITLLLYFNSSWNDEGGRLRILRDSHNLDNYVEEIPPLFGTCLIFKVTDNCWHGHKPFEGERRAIQLNYLSDQAALKQHLSKHKFSARLKTWRRWFTAGDEY